MISSTTITTAVRRHCTDWYEICALTGHEIYYIKIELDLRKISIGPFLETEKGFWVNPTPGGSQCTVECSEKHKSFKLKIPQPDSERRHSPEFRTVFGIMIGPFSFCEIGKT